MKGGEDWLPTASIENLRFRSKALRKVRDFFYLRGAFEVETPVLSSYSATDVHLHQIQTTTGYSLHTSPEFAMKRLLAAHSGDIFQICRVFRQDEVSDRHNPEFTMLEWYRIGVDEFELMKEVVELVRWVSGDSTLASEVVTYREIFLRLGLPDPHQASLVQLKSATLKYLHSDAGLWSRDDCLDALMALVVEPQLPKDRLIFIHNYPASQASLARYHYEDDIKVGRRFELYWQGLELANGYYELTDPEEQGRRFNQESKLRVEAGLSQPMIDRNFLNAMEAGLPDCSGVALGFDRLMMILLKVKSIREVVSFTIERS